jgi:ATHILA ORF-1 family
MDAIQFKDNAQRIQFNTQMDRSYVSTMWYDQVTAEGLGMHADIEEAFGYIGASSLLTMNYPTCPALTAEFLSSFSTDINGPNSDGKVRFRIGNQRHSVHLKKWNRIFGFHHPTEGYNIDQFHLQETWSLLTGSDHLPTQALSVKKIASPLFRVILRILGNTIWARKENSKPTKKELACLHGMLFVPSVPMNMGWEFLKHIKDYESRDGDVWFGGMISRLAMHYEVNLANYSQLGLSYINRAYLVHAKVLVEINGVIHSRVASGHTVPIRASKMDLLHVPNWYETWTGVQRRANSPPGWNPDTNERLRRRERRVYEEEEEQEDVVMQEPMQFLGLEWQGNPGASGSGGGQNPEYPPSYNPNYPPYYNDLCTRIGGWNTSLDEVRKSVDAVRTSLEERNKVEDERWEARNRRDQELWTWAQQNMGFPPHPGPGSDYPPPQNPYF